MGTDKGRGTAGTASPTLLLSTINSLSVGVLLVVPKNDREEIRFINRQLDELLGGGLLPLVGREASEFWDLLIPRLANPYPFRDDLERLSRNPSESRSDILRIARPAPMVFERTTGPLLDAGGKHLGRLWTFRNISGESKTREELQRKRKSEFSFRSLTALLADSPLSPESLTEICRSICLGLDLAGVSYFPLRLMERSSPCHWSVSRRHRLGSHEDSVRQTCVRRARANPSDDPMLVAVRDLAAEEQVPFTDRQIVRFAVRTVGPEAAPGGVLVLEEARISREWRPEDLRVVNSLAGILGLWLAKQESDLSLAQAREAAEAAGKVRTDFIALLSHELRTPLNPLIGFTQLLQEQEANFEPDVRDMVARISDGATRLKDLVEDLLTLTRLDSRLDGWRRYQCDVRSIIDDAFAGASRLAEPKGITVQLEADPALGLVEADGAALRRAINALLSNAVRFTPANGIVRMVVKGEPDGIELSVIDQGPGVTDEAKKKIFEPFVQGEPVLTRRFGGAGIGLTLVRKVAESHRGGITVVDGATGGAIFCLRIPRSPAGGSPP
jgi:signal transduction histidine kinase